MYRLERYLLLQSKTVQIIVMFCTFFMYIYLVDAEHTGKYVYCTLIYQDVI